MPASTIYLMRHGDSRRDAVKRYIGQTDHPLNRTGRAEAEFWRRELQQVPFGRIVSSDLVRALETAQIIAGGDGKSVEICAGLREIRMGAWDGRPVDEIRHDFPDEYERRGAMISGHRPPGGESFDDLARRVLPVFEELVLGSSGNLLSVGHAGVNRVILCHIMGRCRKDLFSIPQDYCCLNLIDYGTAGLRLRERNLSSLDNARLAQ